MSLLPPTPSTSGKLAVASQQKQSKKRKAKSLTKILTPTEYAQTVHNFARLESGAGRNHGALADFLNSQPSSINIFPQEFTVGEDLITLYPLRVGGSQSRETSHSTSSTSPSPSPSRREAQQQQQQQQQYEPLESDYVDQEPADERHYGIVKSYTFIDPEEFYRYNLGKDPESCIIFLRGFLPARWINNIGARYKVDPEFFCRHLNFRPVDDTSNNFSIPALPSSSWHLIELPVMRLGFRDVPTGTLRSDRIGQLRTEGAKELIEHHHTVSKLSSSGMMTGETMVRDFYVFDEAHFVMEQRISICLQLTDDRKTFSLLVWLDSGVEAKRTPPAPWTVKSPSSYYLPVIRHKPNIALKPHLFQPNTSNEMVPPDPLARQVSLANLPVDYGRSLQPNVKARDAFYSLTEIFQFAASSQQSFLNLVDVKLDSYTSQDRGKEFETLPHLTYTKQVLYRQIQKIKRVLESIENARHHNWPKDSTRRGGKKANDTAQSLQQDFQHLLDYAQILHTRATEAIQVLMSSISIAETQTARSHAQRVGKLTFLAFIFVPLGFTTSFFGMNVKQLQGDVGIYWWVVSSVLVTGGAVTMFYMDLLKPFRKAWSSIMSIPERNASLRGDKYEIS